MQLRHLDEAERHIISGERHIAELEQKVLDLEKLGKDSTQARNVLATFYVTQDLHLSHRDLILRELGRIR